ncbi:MAG: hypothetical protein IBX55_00565 [Methyloprofundus sp.]|nr:hypothetical protein [Methyloprofundus sp.]
MKVINTGNIDVLTIEAEVLEGGSSEHSSMYEEESAETVIITVNLKSLNELREKGRSLSEHLDRREVRLEVDDMVSTSFFSTSEDGQIEEVDLSYLRDESATISFRRGREEIALDLRNPHYDDDFWYLRFDIAGAILLSSILRGDVSEGVVISAIEHLKYFSGLGNDIALALLKSQASPDLVFTKDESHSSYCFYRDTVLKNKDLGSDTYKKAETYGGEIALNALRENPCYAKYKESQAISDYRGEIASDIEQSSLAVDNHERLKDK